MEAPTPPPVTVLAKPRRRSGTRRITATDPRRNLPKCYKCGRHLYDGNICRSCGTRLTALDRSRSIRHFRRRVVHRLSSAGFQKVRLQQVALVVVIIVLMLAVIFGLSQIGSPHTLSPVQKVGSAALVYGRLALSPVLHI